jgi:hypothetical protein
VVDLAAGAAPGRRAALWLRRGGHASGGGRAGRARRSVVVGGEVSGPLRGRAVGVAAAVGVGCAVGAGAVGGVTAADAMGECWTAVMPWEDGSV